MQIIRHFLRRPYLYILIVLIGLSIKFYHLDYKLFWFDEVCTIQHTSGIADSEYPKLVPINEVKNITFYKDLYHLKKQDYTIGTQLKGLLSSTQLNPLYYPFLMLWYRIAGDDPVDYRLFNVFIFIISLPFLFLLSRKLFESNLAGWIAVSLYAVSPYIHLFAQEARYYIFWIFIVIVLHYCFLLVMHYNRNKWWTAYSLTAALSLYASPLSIIIIFGHGLFVVLTRRDLLKIFGISMLIVFLVYLPWALTLFFKFDKITSALSWQSNTPFNVSFWLPLIGQCLYMITIFSARLDYFSVFNETSFQVPPDALSAFVFNIIVFVIIITSFVFLIKKAEKEIKYFLLLVIIPGFVFFYINDLYRNAMLSWWWRYLIFIAPGVILVMTNLLYKKIEKGKLLHIVSFLALILFGISSVNRIAETRHWFIGKKLNEYIEDARFISKAERPLIITDFSDNKRMVDFMVVILECSSDNIDILRVSADIKPVENILDHQEYSDIYIFYASDELSGNLKSLYGSKIEKVNVAGISSIWKIIAE